MTDERLVGLAAAGDEVAFAQLALLHRQKLEALAARRYAAGLDRDDMGQEALLALHHAVMSFDPAQGVPFGGFAELVIRRRLDTVVKKALRAKHSFLNDRVSLDYRVGSDDSDGEALGDLIVDEQADTVELLHSRRRLAAVVRVVNGLTDAEKAAIVGLASGDEYEAVAARLGRSKKSIDNSNQRARIKIAAALARLDEAA